MKQEMNYGKGKKGQACHADNDMEAVAEMGVGDLYAVGMSLVVLGIGIAYGQNILTDVKADFTTDSIEYNSTRDTQVAVAKIPKKLGLLVTVIIAAVILGVLTRYLIVRSNEGQ